MSEVFVARVHEADGVPIARALFSKGPRLPAPGQRPGAIVLMDQDSQVKVLAQPGTARARLFGILARHRIDPVFPAAVRAQLADVLAAPGLSDRVLDRTDQAFVTIDNEDSRDLDQALFIERARAGADGFVVHYALADASYYIRPGSPLFEEALRRGVSFYLPHLCVPMLPPELSEGLISLNPDVERRALVFVMQLDGQAKPVKTELIRARIRSRAKLSYAGVQRFFDAPDQSPIAGQEYAASLELLRDVGELRIQIARARDVVEYNRSELAVGFTDAIGSEFVVEQRLRNDVERWNEQVSLLCNMEGANLLLAGIGDEELQPIFRVHPAPQESRVEQLIGMIEQIIDAQGLDDTWRWRREGAEAESLADYLERLPDDSRWTRVRAGIERQVRYTNQPSLFGNEAGPHYALGVEGYARFSSPMREVVGIFTHKEALERLGLAEPTTSSEQDRTLRDRAVEVANEAKRLQRKLTKEANKLAIDQLLQQDLEAEHPPERAGTVLGLRASRLYVQLDAFPIDLKVYTRDLERAHPGAGYRAVGDTLLTPQEGSGAPAFRIGDGVLVHTRGYHDQRGRWELVARREPQAHSSV